MSETWNTLAIKKLSTLITKEADKLGENIASGSAKSYDQYREHVGRFRALHEVLRWCADIDKEISEGKR